MMTLTTMKRRKAKKLLRRIDQSPSPFQAVSTTQAELEQAGFLRLSEVEEWKLEKEGKYYVIRDDSTITAFIVGTESPSTHGFRIIGSHTDSPNLRIKPNADYTSLGYAQVGVEIYGGVLLTSWLDRDLSIAGRVCTATDGHLETHLVHIKQPIFRIPQLAIHLNKEVNRKGLLLDKQNHLSPLFQLQKKKNDPAFLEWLGTHLGVSAQDILSYDLSLYDLQPSSFMGVKEEFLVAPRLDNLFSCFCSLDALLEVLKTETPKATCMLIAFDHEEIGSNTMQGARSSFFSSVVKRIAESYSGETQHAYERAIVNSMFLSADMAHAVHPNYSEKHEPRHRPMINAGPVIKVNVQGSYATNSVSSSQIELICKRNNIPVQKFVNRTDLGCGSTIGPWIASSLGIQTIDIGAPMLSMHSIREMCGSLDVATTTKLFSKFYLES